MADTDIRHVSTNLGFGPDPDDGFADQLARLKLEDKLTHTSFNRPYRGVKTQSAIVKKVMDKSQRPKVQALPPAEDIGLCRLIDELDSQLLPTGFPDIAYVNKLTKKEQAGVAAIMRRERSLARGAIIGHEPGYRVFRQLAAIIAHDPHDDDDDTVTNRTTLLVTPLDDLRLWNQRLKEWFPQLKVGVYYHKSKYNYHTFADFTKFDVVVTLYGTVLLDYRRHNTFLFGDNGCDEADVRRQFVLPLYGDDSVFHRIILNEAHHIQSLKTMTLQAAMALQGRYRLCAIDRSQPQSPTDLFAYVQFLGVAPFDDYQTYQEQVASPLRRKSAGSSDEFARLYRRLEALLVALYVEQRGDPWTKGVLNCNNSDWHPQAKPARDSEAPAPISDPVKEERAV